MLTDKTSHHTASQVWVPFFKYKWNYKDIWGIMWFTNIKMNEKVKDLCQNIEIYYSLHILKPLSHFNPNWPRQPADQHEKIVKQLSSIKDTKLNTISLCIYRCLCSKIFSSFLIMLYFNYRLLKIAIIILKKQRKVEIMYLNWSGQKIFAAKNHVTTNLTTNKSIGLKII